MRLNIFDRLSFLSLFLVVVLLPIFCLPFTNIPVEVSKGLLLVVGLAACIIFWAIARFYDGKIILPKSWLLVSGFGIVLATFLSALFSKTSQVSLFGTMFDIGSFWFIFSGFMLMLLSSVIFRTLKQVKIVLLGTILSSVLVVIFQSVRLFIPTALSLGILADKTGNILGSWNALGLFSGFAALMFLLVIEFFPISKMEKIVLQIFILLSILLTVVVGFSLVWMLLGIFSLIIFVYKASITVESHENKAGEESALVGGEKKHFPVTSFVVLMISLLFFMSGQFIYGFIPASLQIPNTEISPSLADTMSITKTVIVKNPVFGTGPNRFGEAWSMYKPAWINNTQFWDTSFNSGSGLLPTLTVTTGIIGIIAWIIFFILFLVIGVKSVFFSMKNKVNWEMVAFFILSLYLFISSFFYLTGMVIFLLSFVFTGVFVGLAASNSNREISISFLNDHRKSFFSMLLLILVIISSAAITFKYIERFVSVSYFGKAITATTEPLAEGFIGKALALYSNDLYLRTYSQIYLIKLNTIANKGSNLSDADKADIQTSFDQVVSSAQAAVSYNSSNYLNYQLLGSVYQAAGSLGVADAYSKSVQAYQDASNLNPLNPGLKLAMASVSFLNKKVQEAKDYANVALSLKPDYVDTLIILSQIAKSEGNNSEALSYAKDALAITPDDKNLIQYIDSLNQPVPAPVSTPEPAPTTNKSKN